MLQCLQTHCRYPSYIVYQSVKLFDAIMDKISVETMFIQLAALASLWIALKKQEHFDKIPTVSRKQLFFAAFLVFHFDFPFVGYRHGRSRQRSI